MSNSFRPGSRVQTTMLGNSGTVLQSSEGRQGFELVDFDNGNLLWVAVENLEPSSVAAPLKTRKKGKRR